MRSLFNFWTAIRMSIGPPETHSMRKPFALALCSAGISQ
jgi:hypothetical protein